MGEIVKDKKGSLDELDLAILEILKSNAKMKMQEIGESVHLTGQAVSNRVSKMEKMGVITGYSVCLDESFFTHKLTVIITIYMKTQRHSEFKQFLESRKEIQEAHRISGDGCYMLKGAFESQEQLNEFLDDVLEYGNYKINTSIAQIK